MSGHGSKLNLTAGDVDIAARTIWQEARGETFEGQKAVAHVIIERTIFRTGDRWTCVAQTCLDWLQFSGWRDADPSFAKSLRLTVSDPKFRLAVRAFLEAVDEPDFTRGSRHYYAVTMPEPPYWAEGKRPAYKIGNHLFFNNVA